MSTVKDEQEQLVPLFTYSCVRFPDCGWLAINRVPESVVRREARDVTVEVEYFWVNPGRDGWIIMRSNGENGEEQIIGNDINTHKEFFKANEWATWTIRLTNAHFGTRDDGTDLFFYFGADPDDVCYIRRIKVYETATPDNFATFDALELQTHHTPLEQVAVEHLKGYVPFDMITYNGGAEGTRPLSRTRSELEIIYGKADGEITIDGETLPYHAKDIVFVNPDQIHSVDTAIAGSCYFMAFDLVHLEQSFRSDILSDIRLKKKRFRTLVTPADEAYEQLQPLCRSLVHTYRSDSEYKDIKIRSLLLDLVYQCCEHGLIGEVSSSSGDRWAAYVREALMYMEAHLSEPLSVGQIANAVHLSEAYFARLFRRCIGLTPLEQLTGMRLEKATELLAAGTSVTATGLEVGIPHVGHFIRQFKAQYGETPYQWQKKNAV